ncbi:RloB domain-containing protein [Pedobacter gandavensis]|uniref:RloB domain-containing protein n=1 Tax=Pedobacter gandavensis TaxID=2679963 RepID=UPI002930199A|nr:RloB domain-containing protein [Pedobacter gandavensis]
MRQNKVPKRRPGRKTFSIVVDGETEFWYLQKLKTNEDLKGISIQPELPKRKKLADQFEIVKANTITYDVSIWIVDLDVVIAQNTLAELNKFILEVKGNDNIKILINAPCLEFWFLMHVSDQGKYYSECGSVGRQFTNFCLLTDYAKSEKYFIRTNPDIYKRLRPNLQIAISNAKRRGSFDIDQPRQAKAEIYKIFEILGIDLK